MTSIAEKKVDPAEMSKVVPPPDFNLDRAVKDIPEWDKEVFLELISAELSPEQKKMVVSPPKIYPRQKDVMAVHWHPEWIPIDLVVRRLEIMFPNRRSELVIPTQHNELLVWKDYAGVEVDCYSSGFNRKVQLLLHFRADKVAGPRAGALKAMLDHTFKYRSSQLLDYINTVVEPELNDRLKEAVEKIGASRETVELVRFYTARLRQLIYDHESEIPPQMFKNRLVSEFLDAQRIRHSDQTINRAMHLIREIKAIVKRHFPLTYFFRATEVIEEVRSLGGGVVIPHPEQFWPILLADYDVDGYEVWNPMSHNYTEFLIRALNNQNKYQRPGRRELLIFMGDDTHLSVKIRPPDLLERPKLEREVGLQPAWDDMAIRKSLSLAEASREKVIESYKERLA